MAWAWTSGVEEGLLTLDLLRLGGAHGGPSPYLLAIHGAAPRLQRASRRGADAAAFAAWGWLAVTQRGLDPVLLGTAARPRRGIGVARSRARRRAAAGVRGLPLDAALLAAGRGLLVPSGRCVRRAPGARRAAGARSARREGGAPRLLVQPWPGASSTSAPPSTATTRSMDGWWALAGDGVTEVDLDAQHVGMLREPGRRAAAQASGGDRGAHAPAR